MSSGSSRNSELRASNVPREQRLRLNYEFATHVIVTFQTSKAAYVQPFLQPVNAEGDGANDNHETIEHPMNLSTILEELENGEYNSISDVKDSFNRMLSECHEHNKLIPKIHQKRFNFKRAFDTIWAGKDRWIKAQAARLSDPSEEDTADEGSEKTLNDASDDDQLKDANESDEDTQEDDELFEDDRPAVQPRKHELHKNESTDGSRGSRNRAEPPFKAARKKSGGKYFPWTINTTPSLNINQKRPLDDTSGREDKTPSRDYVSSTKQPTESSLSVQHQAVSAGQVARKSTLRNIFQDHFGDSFKPPQIEQPQTEQPQPESSQPAPSSASDPDPNPLKTMLSDIVTKQIDATTTRINANENGEFTEHLALLAQICNNENRENFYQLWKDRALKDVSRMQVKDILVRGVEREIGLALAETVIEQTDEFTEQMGRRAIAFSAAFGGEGER